MSLPFVRSLRCVALHSVGLRYKSLDEIKPFWQDDEDDDGANGDGLGDLTSPQNVRREQARQLLVAANTPRWGRPDSPETGAGESQAVGNGGNRRANDNAGSTRTQDGGATRGNSGAGTGSTLPSIHTKPSAFAELNAGNRPGGDSTARLHNATASAGRKLLEDGLNGRVEDGFAADSDPRTGARGRRGNDRGDVRFGRASARSQIPERPRTSATTRQRGRRRGNRGLGGEHGSGGGGHGRHRRSSSVGQNPIAHFPRATPPPIFLNDKEAATNAMEAAAARRLLRAAQRSDNDAAGSSSKLLPSLVSFSFDSSVQMGQANEEQRRRRDARESAKAAALAGLQPTHAELYGPRFHKIPPSKVAQVEPEKPMSPTSPNFCGGLVHGRERDRNRSRNSTKPTAPLSPWGVNNQARAQTQHGHRQHHHKSPRHPRGAQFDVNVGHGNTPGFFDDNGSNRLRRAQTSATSSGNSGRHKLSKRSSDSRREGVSDVLGFNRGSVARSNWQW